MGCEVSIQVHPMPVPVEEEPTVETEKLTVETKPAVATKLSRQDSMSSNVTIMLDESDFSM